MGDGGGVQTSPIVFHFHFQVYYPGAAVEAKSPRLPTAGTVAP